MLDRKEWLQRYYSKWTDHDQWSQRWSDDRRSAHFQTSQASRALRALEQQYAEWLPIVALSRCPFCDKPALCRFDPVDFEGPWWWASFSLANEPPGCPHFMGLLGAVHHAGQEHIAGRFDVLPGPEVPYVVPRLLDVPGTIAVLGTRSMDNGCTAHPIGYFAEKRPAPHGRFAPWPRTHLSWATVDGKIGWLGGPEEREFDMHRYAADGRIWALVDGRLQAISPDSALLTSSGRREDVLVPRASLAARPDSLS